MYRREAMRGAMEAPEEVVVVFVADPTSGESSASLRPLAEERSWLDMASKMRAA